MTHAHRHLREKIQVQAAALLGLLLAWFVLWPAVKPADPLGALSFLPGGDYGRLGVFALCTWGLALICGLLTLSARFEGAMLAMLVGVAAFSCRSDPMQNLLWRWPGDYGHVYAALAGESLLMLGILLVAVILVAVIRRFAGEFWPEWSWKDPLANREHVEQAVASDKSSQWLQRYVPGLTLITLLSPFGRRLGRKSAGALGACILLEMALALVLLVMTFRSGLFRGQVIFALAASFFVSTLVAHQVFATRFSLPCWAAPLLTAVVVYMLGVHSWDKAEPGWLFSMMLDSKGQLPLRGALPADWLSAGVGGAVLGFWLSGRIHEARAAEKEKEKEGNSE